MNGAATNSEAGGTRAGSFFLIALAIGVFLALLAAGFVAGELAEIQRNGSTL